jgi:hypothetical protein
MKPFIVFSLLLSVMYFSFAEDAPKVAVASMIRGDVDLLIMGKTVKLKKDDWVREGSVVKTADKSFVKLIFIDKSQMNIGPNSEMKIAKFSGNDAGIIDLVKGKIRSQVTKDYLQMKDKDKSKLFIKTPNAVMGVRGTDFQISVAKNADSVVLFEGHVVFAKLENHNTNNTNKLEDIVNKQGVSMQPGEFSVLDSKNPHPTLPAKLNVQQHEALQKNVTFDKRSPGNEESDSSKNSVVPGGLSSVVVSNDSSALASNASGTDTSSGSNTDLAKVDGFVKGDDIQPAAGSVLDVNSGAIIPPDASSLLDKNTDSYGLSTGVTIETDGSVSIKGAEINSDGKLMLTVVGSDGKLQVVVREIQPPVKSEISTFVGPVGAGPAPAPGPAILKNPDITLNPAGPGLMPPPPSGGIMTVNDAAQQLSSKTKTTINGTSTGP